MANINIIRGRKVLFSTTFTNPDGSTLNPNSTGGATLYIIFNKLEVQQKLKVAMATADSGVTWTYTWDTAQADAGTVYWHARCSGDADEDSFTIVANIANPVPTP